MSHVFISYSRRNRKYAGKLAAHLRDACGIPVWIDDEIITGDRWERMIKTKIDGCAAFIVIMSGAAEESDWVGREITRAEGKGKPLFPVLLEGEVFFRLTDIQFEDVRGGVLPGERFVEALRATPIDTVVEMTAAKPHLPGPARRVFWLAALVAVLVVSGAGIWWKGFGSDEQVQGTGASSSSTVAVTTTSVTPSTTLVPAPTQPGALASSAVKNVDVRVYNNATVPGLASLAHQIFKEGGWTVVETGNYAQGQVSASTVYYVPGTAEKESAEALADQFGLRVEARFEGILNAHQGLIVIVTNDFSATKR